MIPQSLHFFLGLCQRAGKLASGDVAVEQALKKGHGVLMLLAEDVSERTRDRLLLLAERHRVPCYRIGARDDLGAAIGKAHRAALVIQSSDFARGIIGVLEKEGLTPVRGRG